jgi:hypothetical protein
MLTGWHEHEAAGVNGSRRLLESDGAARTVSFDYKDYWALLPFAGMSFT